jgi:hypothetical protein
VVSTEALTFTLRRRTAALSERRLESETRIGDHLGVHDGVEVVNRSVLRERVQRGIEVILLGHLGELPERHVMLARVVHASLGEYARHQPGAEDALGPHDRSEAAAGREHPAIGAGLAGRAEHAHLAHLLRAHDQRHVGLAGLDGEVRDPYRGRACRAGVEDVVRLDTGLADLLLDALGHHAAGLVGVPDGEHTDVADGHVRVGERIERRSGTQVDQVAVLVPAERRHRRADDPGRLIAHHESCPSWA